MIPASWLSPAPRALDIVFTYFPYQEDNGRPALDKHPAVVLAVGMKPDGSLRLLAAYGSSRGLYQPAPSNVIVEPEHYPDSGLWYPTRFDLARHAWLDYDAKYFCNAPDRKSPIMGRFPEAVMGDFNRARRVVEASLGRGIVPGRPALDP